MDVPRGTVLMQPPPDHYEIEPATIAQVRMSRCGRKVLIEDDVGGVAAGLREIDYRLRLRFSELGNYYVVYFWHPAGCDCPDHCDPDDEHLILTALECDQRIVQRLRIIDQQGRSGYDFVKELERIDAEREQKIKDSVFTDERKEAIARGQYEIARATKSAPRSTQRGSTSHDRIVVPRGT